MKLVKALSAIRTSTNGTYEVVRLIPSLHGGVRIVMGTIRTSTNGSRNIDSQCTIRTLLYDSYSFLGFVHPARFVESGRI